MVHYITKENVGSEISSIIYGNSNWEKSLLPRLAFDNEEQIRKCETCGETSSEVEFQYNISNASGFDEVVFDWNLELERVYLTGVMCKECGTGTVTLHENDVGENGEVIFERN